MKNEKATITAGMLLSTSILQATKIIFVELCGDKICALTKDTWLIDYVEEKIKNREVAYVNATFSETEGVHMYVHLY